MNIYSRAYSFRQKCISRLSRQDAEFFLAEGTMKDLSILCLILQRKKVHFEEFQANLMFARYFQILMMFSCVSDDYRDQNLVDRFGPVPFYCEQIIKGRRPYQSNDLVRGSYDLIRTQYPLSTLCEIASIDTSRICELVPTAHHEMNQRMLEYYTTPIIGAAAILKIRPRDFSFRNDMQTVYEQILRKHFKNRSVLKGDVAEYVRVMELISSADSCDKYHNIAA